MKKTEPSSRCVALSISVQYAAFAPESPFQFGTVYVARIKDLCYFEKKNIHIAITNLKYMRFSFNNIKYKKSPKYVM